MKQIRWLEADAVGHTVIDREHRAIVAVLNEAIRAFNDRDTETCSEAIDRAVEAIRRHFASEEAILVDSGCRGDSFTNHAAYHRRLLAEAEQIGRLCRNDPQRAFLEARLAELVHFVTYEIRNCDSALGRNLIGPREMAMRR
ncbi:MAG: bacteriohemerythrin [Rhodospirillales bacterium]